MITTMLRWKTSTAREKTTTQMIILPFLCGDLFSRACTWLFPHRFEWIQTQKCIHVFESTKYDAPISPQYPIRIGFSCRSSDSFVEFGNRPTPVWHSEAINSSNNTSGSNWTFYGINWKNDTNYVRVCDSIAWLQIFCFTLGTFAD